jgi:hypothetical protein
MEMTAKIIRLTPFLTDACVSTVAFIFVFLSCCIYRGSGSLPDGPARGPETQRFTVSCKKRKKTEQLLFYFNSAHVPVQVIYLSFGTRQTGQDAILN